MHNVQTRWHSQSRYSEFQHLNSYFDKRSGMCTVKLLPGQFYVTENPEVIVTVLGSCIAACIRDPESGIGGMNHFMLPVFKGEAKKWDPSTANPVNRFGDYAMEHLINTIMAHGGHKDNLEIKLFGGSRIVKNMSDIGEQNIRFVFDFLKQENLSVAASDVSGNCPRKVYYFPETGRVRLKKLSSLHNNTIIERETHYMHEINKKSVTGEVDLF